MDLLKRGEGPPTGLLIDLGDSPFQSTGYSYGYGTGASFNAEEAILDVFGSFFNKPNVNDPLLSPNGATPVPQPPTEESPETNRQGDVASRIGASSQQLKSATSGPFGNHGHQVVPSLMTTSFKPNRRGFGGPLSDGFGGPIPDSSIGSRPFSSGFGAPPNGFSCSTNGGGGFSSSGGGGFGGHSQVSRFDRPPSGSYGGFERAPPTGGHGSQFRGGFGVDAAPAGAGFFGDGFDIENPGSHEAPITRRFGRGNNSNSGFGNHPAGSPVGEFGCQAAGDGFDKSQVGPDAQGGSDVGSFSCGRGFGEDRGFGREARRGPCFGSTASSSSISGIVAPQAKDDPRLSRGFGRSNEDIARLPCRSLSGRSSKVSGRGRKRGGRGRGRSSLAAFLDSESPSDTLCTFTSHFEVSKENAYDPLVVASKRPPNFGDRHYSREAPHKRRRVSCGKCGRAGHETEVCYTNQNRASLRCYNCNQIGHLSVRCALPRDLTRGSPRGRAPDTNIVKDAGQASESASNRQRAASNEKNETMCVSMLCMLMQDPQVRVDMVRSNANLHDDILVYMLKRVQL